MLRKCAVLLPGTLVAALVLIAGASAVMHPFSAPRLELSTRSAVVKHLNSLGVDSKGIVIQRGARNYAGPKCPGPGWTCTKSKRVVQLSNAINVSTFPCTPSSGGFASPPDDCVIVQSSTGATNSASCVEKGHGHRRPELPDLPGEHDGHEQRHDHAGGRHCDRRESGSQAVLRHPAGERERAEQRERDADDLPSSRPSPPPEERRPRTGARWRP